MTADHVRDDPASRQALVDRILSQPPAVHYITLEDVALNRVTGAHSAQEAEYRCLARHCRPGIQTLETGSGLSTILFAAWGANHVCITPVQAEVDAIRAHCLNQDISLEHVTFEVDGSDVILGREGPGGSPLDLVFIDGGHGFAMPIIDWHYAGSRLREGGLLVVDDIHLPAVRVLHHYLTCDPRWRQVDGSRFWAAYERRSEGSLAEDWYVQPFYRFRSRGLHSIGPREAELRRRLLGPARRQVARHIAKWRSPH